MTAFRIHRGLPGFMLAVCACLGGEAAAASAIPDAPPTPTCSWGPVSSQRLSNCEFKRTMDGTPTSVVGNRVILFRRSANGGHGTSRTASEQALLRLAERYRFTLTVSEDPAVFSADTLANTKVVVLSGGDGDVVPAGGYRSALEDFQQARGWGVIWLHAACAFITSGWPFGQQSCVEQYYFHDPSGTQRRVFVDSGTAAMPEQGIRNPQTEFLLRSLPGWSAKRTLTLGDEFHCFRAPARNTAGVNVLLGYDRSSGLPVSKQCPGSDDMSEAGSQLHNLAWTHHMGKGITIVNSLGHDAGVYTSNTNAGDSLLWRLIRYAAKDWEPGVPVSILAAAKPMLDRTVATGSVELAFADAGSHAVTVSDIAGKRVFARSYTGVTRAEIPGLERGIYLVKVVSGRRNESRKIRVL